MRKAAARAKEVLWQTIGQLLDEFPPDECVNYFTAAGYEPEQLENALVLLVRPILLIRIHVRPAPPCVATNCIGIARGSCRGAFREP